MTPLTGLEYLQKMLAGEIPTPPMLLMFGIKLREVEYGRVLFTVTVEERFYNGNGVTHGGFAATVLDTALGTAVNSTAVGRRFTTLELKVNLLRALTADVGELQCEGRALHVGRRTGFSEARLFDRNNKLYAHATTTCIVVEGADSFPTG